MELIRKITLKNCGATAKVLKEAVTKVKEGDSVPAVRVVGIVNGYKPGQTDKGEYLLLLGEFNAINLLDGRRFFAPKAILPNFIAETFAPVLNQSNSVEFALEISATRQDSAVTGYVFSARPLIESKANERMTELFALAIDGASLPEPSTSESAPSLPAPAKSKRKK